MNEEKLKKQINSMWKKIHNANSENELVNLLKNQKYKNSELANIKKLNLWDEISTKIWQIFENIKKTKNKKQKLLEDKEELKKVLYEELLNYEDSRMRSTNITKILSDLAENQFNNYKLFRTRQVVYEVIASIRKDFREMGDWCGGYIISGNAIAYEDEREGKIDGWMFTKKKELILKYINARITGAKSIIEIYENFKNIVEP